MTLEDRKKLIDYIKANDHTYNYNAVNFKYYTDKDLLSRKERLVKNEKRKKIKTIQKGKAISFLPQTKNPVRN
jgi:hypothetical protein